MHRRGKLELLLDWRKWNHHPLWEVFKWHSSPLQTLAFLQPCWVPLPCRQLNFKHQNCPSSQWKQLLSTWHLHRTILLKKIPFSDLQRIRKRLFSKNLTQVLITCGAYMRLLLKYLHSGTWWWRRTFDWTCKQEQVHAFMQMALTLTWLVVV